jgi:protein-L-isoaspartate O-methyltransferase
VLQADEFSNESLGRVAGPCSASFNKMDRKWTTKPEYILETDIWKMDSFDLNEREAFEPQKNYWQSAAIGTHAFIVSQLKDALTNAAPGTAVVDIGSGTGFLLSVFASLVTEPEVDIVGVEMEKEAYEHALKAVPEWAKVFNENALEFKYNKTFSVMNIGFASSQIPEYFKAMLADQATVLMPICTGPKEGIACPCKFNIFRKLGENSTSLQEVGPGMKFFYVDTT